MLSLALPRFVDSLIHRRAARDGVDIILRCRGCAARSVLHMRRVERRSSYTASHDAQDAGGASAAAAHAMMPRVMRDMRAEYMSAQRAARRRAAQAGMRRRAQHTRPPSETTSYHCLIFAHHGRHRLALCRLIFAHFHHHHALLFMPMPRRARFIRHIVIGYAISPRHARLRALRHY